MEKKKTSIIFSGDIGFDKYMDKKWEDNNLLSKPVLDFFHSADHVCLNVEGAICEAEDTGSKSASLYGCGGFVKAYFYRRKDRI